MESDAKLTGLIVLVILVVVAAVLYPLVGDRVADLTNESGADYVGSDSESIVSMIPIFYWLGVALAVIGGAVVAIKSSL